MARTVTGTVASAIAASNVPMLVFVELSFPSGALRFTNADVPRTWNGYTWIGGASCTGLQPIEETSTPSSAQLAVVLTGIAASYVSSVMTEHYQGQPARIWLAPLDGNHSVLADPVLVFSGRMDEPSIALGETATITIGLENRWADWDRPRVRRFNGADQEAEWPGDLFFQYVEAMESAELSWGLYKGPTAPKLQIPRGVMLALLNPYLVFARPVQQLFRRIF